MFTCSEKIENEDLKKNKDMLDIYIETQNVVLKLKKNKEIQRL